MPLADLLERNRAFLTGRTPKPLPPPESVDQLVIACYDPRLDGVLRGALGLDDGRAFLIRTAGAVVAPDGDPLRSIALAVYLFAARSVAVVGHTSCRMAAFDTARFIDAFRARGVRRDAFGAGDLRAWTGAIPDPRRGVQGSVAALRGAPCLPRDLEISGLLLDDASGTLEVVVKPDEAVPAAAPAEPAAGPPGVEDSNREEEPSETPRARPEAGPAAAPTPTPDLAKLVAAASAFVQTAASHTTWRELEKLRTELRAERNPLSRIRRIEAFVRKTVADSREVAAALERLKREAQGSNVHLDEGLLFELVRRAIMGEKP